MDAVVQRNFLAPVVELQLSIEAESLGCGGLARLNNDKWGFLDKNATDEL